MNNVFTNPTEAPRYNVRDEVAKAVNDYVRYTNDMISSFLLYGSISKEQSERTQGAAIKLLAVVKDIPADLTAPGFSKFP
jgi:hypothetical protein